MLDKQTRGGEALLHYLWNDYIYHMHAWTICSHKVLFTMHTSHTLTDSVSREFCEHFYVHVAAIN